MAKTTAPADTAAELTKGPDDTAKVAAIQARSKEINAWINFTDKKQQQPNKAVAQKIIEENPSNFLDVIDKLIPGTTIAELNA